jgi:hypothetical protein
MANILSTKADSGETRGVMLKLGISNANGGGY